MNIEENQNNSLNTDTSVYKHIKPPKSHKYFLISVFIIGFIIIMYLLYVNGKSIYEGGI